jgi:hypothetical protein
MRYPALALAGFVALALAGSSALAKDPTTRTMTVQLPHGGTATIEYAGDVAPKVTFSDGPFAWPAFDLSRPFAEFDRIEAEMHRRMEAIMRQAHELAGKDDLGEAAIQSVPAGTESYSFVSTVTRDGACSHMVQVTKTTKDTKPNVVKRSFGDCGADEAARARDEGTSL